VDTVCDLLTYGIFHCAVGSEHVWEEIMKELSFPFMGLAE
jgi:hypothetical protein